MDAKVAILTSQEEILNCFAEFYSAFYAKQDRDNEVGTEAILDEPQLPWVDEDIRAQLSAPQKEAYVRWPVRHMNMGRAPGNDGPTVEFYQTYVDLLTPIKKQWLWEFAKSTRAAWGVRHRLIYSGIGQGSLAEWEIVEVHLQKEMEDGAEAQGQELNDA
ncbi:hypothetical protein NDU88_004964 [Pleurodeles waltl]|uniref:Uncharacterized protein n=1 Tax=Pleurodeles waltl TaxID=8319 RepID=A0AAV7UIH6_PLEWA|nr:hypothetical protein NDU88_004964 [Pleurodeles waltl]